MPQFKIFAAFVCDEGLMAATLNDFSFVEDYYVVTKTARGEAMRNVNCGFIAYDIVEVLVNLRFCNGI